MIESVTLKLSDVLPNPFRNLVKYPLDAEKLATLQRSIENTKFWTNVAVREQKNGKYELVYGHHRLAAAIKAGVKEHDFIVEVLTDEEMLMWLALDNADVYGANYSWSVLESVEGVVTALGDGRLKPFHIVKDTRKDFLRYAPSFIPGKEPEGNLPSRPYTAACVAKQLGFTMSMAADREAEKANSKVTAALGALYLIELGQLTPTVVKQWTISQMLTETRARIGVYKETVIRREQDAQKRAKLREQQLELDKQRKAEAENIRLANVALLEKERQARKAKAEEDALRFAEERKENDRRREEREQQFKTKRAALDEKVEKVNVEAQERRDRDKSLPTRHAVKAMLFKLNTITSESFAFREEVKNMSRNSDVTVNERELIRQAMLAASEWYAYQANLFAGVVQVNPLIEARQREESKRKRGRNEQE